MTKFKRVRINTQVFTNKIPGFGGSPWLRSGPLGLTPLCKLYSTWCFISKENTIGKCDCFHSDGHLRRHSPTCTRPLLRVADYGAEPRDSAP